MDRWVCLRCYTSNEASAATCIKCGLLRGSMAPAEPQGAVASPVAPARAGIFGGLLRRFGWLAVVGAFAVGGAIFAAQRDDSGQITHGGSLAINDLRVGDCFNPKDVDAEQANEVDAKRCTDAHQFEMMFVGTMPDGEYPTESQFEDYVGTVCLPAFEDYVGLAYEASKLDVYWYIPLEGGWKQGDHVVECAIYDPLDSQLEGSRRGSAN